MPKLNTTVAALLSLSVLLAFLAGQSVAGRYYYDEEQHGRYYYDKEQDGRYYYDKVQDMVRKEVEKAMEHNPSIGPALVRLVFHDCWVNGCDGSVLLDESPTDGTNTEKKAANNIGLAGFEVIDAIKEKVGTDASCADILAFAARDAADILSAGKIFYKLQGGRKDGVVSSPAAADDNLPHPNFDFDQLRDNFNNTGRGRDFSVEELVVMSGAHSIGVAHLSSYQDRLGPDSTPIDPNYQAALNKATPPELLKSGQNPTVTNNVRDETDEFQKNAAYDPVAMGVNPKRVVLDNSYYHNNLVNKVLFKSDWVLRTDDFAASKLDEYKNNPAEWNTDFAAAMVKLSSLLPAQGNKLEIRKNCRFTNQQYSD